MFGKTASAMFMLMFLVFATATRAAEDPTMHQIYAAAEAGQFAEAQRMMDQVLRDHPNSSKAHFVEAELLAKQGRTTDAAAELSKAENLSPGLPFAKPASVQRLKQLVAGPQRNAVNGYAAQPPAAVGGGIPWMALVLGGGLIAAVIYGLRAMFSRRTTPASMSGNSMYGNGAGYGAAPMGQAPQAGGSGIGSNIVSGLATGAAVGAGIVAGEALVHHFMDGDRHGGGSLSPSGLSPSGNDNIVVDDDMGGTDFGIDDSSSWDDSSIGGGDDSSW